MKFTNLEHVNEEKENRKSGIVDPQGLFVGLTTDATGEKLNFPVEIADVDIAGPIRVFAGTNGYQGGDSGHGGRAYIAVTVPEEYDIHIKTRKTSRRHCSGCASGYTEDLQNLEIVTGGDWELQSLVESLRFILTTLEKHISERRRK